MEDGRILEVILNPAASGGAGARVRPQVEGELKRRGIPFRLQVTAAPGHATSLAREAAEGGAGRILVVGGDGTLHEVANGLLEDGSEPPPLALVPVGTGNDFFRMVGLPRQVGAAMEVLETGEVRAFDVGWVRFGERERFFVNLLGVGVDVEVLRRRAGFRRLRGLPQYLAALVTTLAVFRPQPFRVTLEDTGEVLEDRVLLAAVTVGPSVGGGFLLSPRASPEDGLLDLFFVGTLGMLTIARYIPRIIRGTHQDLPEVTLRQLRRVGIARPDGGPFHFELDGELVEAAADRLEIEVRPGRLKVLLPRRAR